MSVNFREKILTLLETISYEYAALTLRNLKPKQKTFKTDETKTKYTLHMVKGLMHNFTTQLRIFGKHVKYISNEIELNKTFHVFLVKKKN